MILKYKVPTLSVHLTSIQIIETVLDSIQVNQKDTREVFPSKNRYTQHNVILSIHFILHFTFKEYAWKSPTLNNIQL